MESLKIWYSDFWPEFKDSENFIEPILKKHFNIVLDQQNPDVLFHSIFGGMRESTGFNCKKIQFIGENRRPHPGSNYSISFDPHSDGNFRLPLWQVFLLKQSDLMDLLYKRVRHGSFDRFCSFTVSNSNNFERNNAFQQINSYKPVSSYGRYLTNDFHLQEYSKDKYWRHAKTKFFMENRHKFSIAYENNSYPGYCTEKLMDSFIGGSLPVYSGDPYVSKDWNKKAFINANFSDYLSEIKRLDQNDDAFYDMYLQPVFTNSQMDKLENNLGEFENWLLKVVKA